MLHRRTIRQRILITFITIVLTGGALQLLIAGHQLQQATIEFYQHHLETDALLLSAAFSEPLGHFLEGEEEADFPQTLARLQQELTHDHDYLILDATYRVIGYTPDYEPQSLSRVPETPELSTARARKIGANIRSDEQGENTLYVAVQILDEDKLVGYLVLSRAMQPAYTEAFQRWLELLLVSMPVLALVTIASLWISGTILRPIEHLKNSALRIASGDFKARIESHTDDEVGQLAQTFNYMAGQIENLLKTQRSFVSNAAHELRTPLMNLKLRIEALNDPSLPRTDHEHYLTEIQQEVDHMAALVSSLLVLARIDEGRHLADRSPTDTASAIHDLVRQWRITAEKVGVNLAAHLPPNIPDLSVSSSDLRLILDNLLSNAIKYSPQGAVQFNVMIEASSLIITIRDDGIGFSPDQAQRLFERFYRSEEARSTFQGNGLGLSIVKAIVEQNAGQITAHSAGYGCGATFTVRFPTGEQQADPAIDRHLIADRSAVPNGLL